MGTRRDRAIALVTVVSLIAVMTVFTLAIFSMSQTEKVTARSNADAERTRQLADSAVNMVMGQIWAGTKSTGAPRIWASQPGAIRSYSANGTFSTGYRLYTSDQMVVTGAENQMISDTPPAGWANEPTRYTDLNEPVIKAAIGGGGAASLYFPIVDPRAFIPSQFSATEGPNVEGFWYDQSYSGVSAATSATDIAARLPMPVQWLYVLKNGGVGTLNAAGIFQPADATGSVPSTANPIIGRVAFWTDDESCKININTAGEPSYWSPPLFMHSRDQSWAWYQPTSFEYQRYPGHPASIALSSVLYPNREMDLYDLRFDLSRYSKVFAWKEMIYGVMPKLNSGGSRGGTVPFWNHVSFDTTGDGLVENQVGQATDLTAAIKERLYASVDELLFTQQISGKKRGLQEMGTGSNALFGTESDLEKSRFFLTTHSRVPEVNMFGTPRIAIWPVADENLGPQYRTGFDQLVAFCSTLGNGQSNSYFFRRQDSQHPTTDIQLPRNAALIGYLNALMGKTFPGGTTTSSLTAKYPQDSAQIIVQIFDYIRSTNLYDGFLAPSRSKLLEVNSDYDLNGSKYKNGPSEPNREGDWHRNRPKTYKTFTPDKASRAHTESSTINQSTEKERVADRAFPGHGQVVPSEYQNGAGRGFGRFPTLSEFGFQFICTADGNPDKGSYRRVNANGSRPPWNQAQADLAARQGINSSVSGGRTAIRMDPHDMGEVGAGSAVTDMNGANQEFWYSNFPPYPALSAYGGRTTPDGKLHPGFDPRNWNISLQPNQPLLPGEKRVQGVIQLELTIVNAGFSKVNPEFSIVINGADSIKLDGQPMFEAGVAGKLIWKSGMEMFDKNGCRGLGASLNTDALLVGRSVRAFSSDPRLRGSADINYDSSANASGDPHKGILNFDLVTNFVTVKGTSMTFTGAPITVEIWAGHDVTKSEMKVQTINLNIPNNIILPPPELVTISVDHGLTQDNQGRFTERMNVEAPRWWIFSKSGAINRFTGTWPGSVTLIQPQMPGINVTSMKNVISGRSLAGSSRGLGRLADWGGYDDGSVEGVPLGGTVFGYDANNGSFNGGRLHPVTPTLDSSRDRFSDTQLADRQPEGSNAADMRGTDVLFTMVPKHGDIRLIAAKKNVPASDWMLHPKAASLGVTNPASPSYFAHNLSRYNSSGEPGFDRGTTNLRLVTNAFYTGGKYPDLPAESTASTQAKMYGDFDNGVGGLRDGAWINKPDEGNALISWQRMDADTIRRQIGAYFLDPDDLFTSEDVGSNYNTPNRLMPSPGVFGSLPVGVVSGNPWRTLLFRPSIARNFGASVHPGSLGPADHNIMDLFWMPIVEPYAISESFSTAGKVNINYQMVPFSHIRRATSVHAVLKGEIMAAIPTNDAGEGNLTTQGYANARKAGMGAYKDYPKIHSSGTTDFGKLIQSNTPDNQYYWSLWRDMPEGSAINSDSNQKYNQLYPLKKWYRKIEIERRTSAGAATVQGTLQQFDNRFRFVASTGTPASTHGLFRTASQICEIHLLPKKMLQTQANDGGDPASPNFFTVNDMANFWNTRQITGDNTRERPYTNIYGKITTQSNTFRVHLRAQAISKALRSVDPNKFDPEKDKIVSDYRGSVLIERRIDPSNPDIPDYTNLGVINSLPSKSLENFYRFRVLENKRFSP